LTKKAPHIKDLRLYSYVFLCVMICTSVCIGVTAWAKRSKGTLLEWAFT